MKHLYEPFNERERIDRERTNRRSNAIALIGGAAIFYILSLAYFKPFTPDKNEEQILNCMEMKGDLNSKIFYQECLEGILKRR